jgi:hypothetical protein
MISAVDTYRSSQFIYAAQQRIDGVGFFNSYQKVNTINQTYGHILGYGELSHGSGDYKRELTLSAWSQAIVDEQGQTAQTSTTKHNITFGESTDYLYHPVDFSFGKSFKSPPIASKGKEDTCLWDYASNVRMTSLFDSATALSKEIKGSLFFDDIYTDNEIERIRSTPTAVEMNINADVTGHAELGMLEARQGPYGKGITVSGELAQDYKGTFTIAQKLSHKIDYKKTVLDDDWLPCCYGGYLTMPKWYQRGTRGFGSDVKSIFDCTSCFEPAPPQLPSRPTL